MNTLEAEALFVAYCEQRKLSFETIKWYKNFIKVLNAKYTELPTTPEPIEEIIGSYPGQYRRLGCFRALRAFYYWICGRYELPNPFKKGDRIIIRSPKVSKIEQPTITLEQMTELLEYPSHPRAVKSLLYFLCDSGARIGEAANLRREDIEDAKVTIRGKTGERTIPISPNVRDMLLDLNDNDFRGSKCKNDKREYIFKVSVEQMTRYVSDAFSKIGMKGFHAHLIRHSFCTLFKGDILSLRLISGHTNWQMLEHYRHNRLDTAQEQHSTGSPLALIHKNVTIEQKQGISNEIIDNVPPEIQQMSIAGDRILIGIPAGFKGMTLHISLS